MSNGSQKSSSSYHFLAGLSSGIFSAILLQPADLLKTRVQQSHSTTLLSTIRSISSSPNSIFAFWRGTLPSALRTGFGSAIYFTSLNALRNHVAHSNLLLKVGVLDKSTHHTINHSSTLPKLSNLANLTTGAIARTGAGLILMPMTIIKVRYESSFYHYRSIAHASTDILKTEGLKGFFSGFGATAIRDAPYAGLYVLFYEQLKKQLSILSETIPAIPIPIEGVVVVPPTMQKMSGSTSLSINFTSGILAAGLATAFTNPFDAIKTRIQLKPKEYHNLWHAARRMVGEEGWKSLLDGLGLRMGRKALSSALAWTVYEELVRRAGEGVGWLGGRRREGGVV